MDRIRERISPFPTELAARRRDSDAGDTQQAQSEQLLETLEELADEAWGLQLEELQQAIALIVSAERDPQSQPFRFRYTVREMLWKFEAIAGVAAARGRGASLQEMQKDFCAQAANTLNRARKLIALSDTRNVEWQTLADTVDVLKYQGQEIEIPAPFVLRLWNLSNGFSKDEVDRAIGMLELFRPKPGNPSKPPSSAG
jgi:hypothetical protein